MVRFDVVDLSEDAKELYDFVVTILNRIQSISVVALILICLVLYYLEKKKKISKKVLQWVLRYGIGILLTQSGLIQIAVSLAAQRAPQILEPFMPLLGFIILLWIKQQI